MLLCILSVRPRLSSALCFHWVHIWPSEPATGRSVDFNLLQEEVTTSPFAKYFHNRGQVRTGNHQRTVSVFVYHKWATDGLWLGKWCVNMAWSSTFFCSLWADDCQEVFCDNVGCRMYDLRFRLLLFECQTCHAYIRNGNCMTLAIRLF